MSEPVPHNTPSEGLTPIVDRLVASYREHRSLQHLDSIFLPNRSQTVEALELLRRLVFPGFFDEVRITSDNVRGHVGELLGRARGLLYEQFRQTLRYRLNAASETRVGDECDDCDAEAERLTAEFLDRLPAIRRMLATDVQAAFAGDPAAISTDEAIFCYPGIDAVFTYRVAHEWHRLGLPLLARIASECAHNETGIDIHPGALIDESFFIDHGTGVVIGETCVIGKRVKLYQGVTLGALSTKGGQAWRGMKRHPTLEDDVTVYGGAIILGGDTVIGEGATIGGSVFLTDSVPAGHTVTMKTPELHSRPPKRQRKRPRAEAGDAAADAIMSFDPGI